MAQTRFIFEDPFCTYVFQNSGLNDGN